MKPKLLLFIPTQNEVQRFVIGRAFVLLEHHFHVIYVLPRADREKLIPLMGNIAEDAEIRFLDISPDRFKSWSKLFKMACYQYSHKSRSFALRINAEKYAGKSGKKRLNQDRIYYAGPTALSSLLDRLMAKIGLSDRPNKREKNSGKLNMFDAETYRKYRQKMLAKLGPSNEVEALLTEINPLAVIIPSSLLDVFCSDVIWSANENEFDSVVLQSGWDNLSSKGILHHLPVYMGVWGKQSSSHAIDIQGMKETMLAELGAPHYEALTPSSETERNMTRDELGVASDEKLVMFGGSFRQFDETQALHELDAYIEEKNLKCKILYRPHPYRLDRDGEDDFFQSDWKHVVFDGEMLERYRFSKATAGYIKRERPLYSMDYLVRAISCADAVISPMSTLLLEAMIIGKPSMAIAYSDDRHSYSAASASEMTHFDILKKRDKALIWCTDRRKFLSEFERLLARPADLGMLTAQKEIINDTVKMEPGRYADRLFSFIADKVAPAILKKRKKRFDRQSSISHHYSADRILQSYVGDTRKPLHVPGYWMHGWLPEYFNRHYGLIALHKKIGIDGADRVDQHEIEKETEFQLVSRLDQAEYLTAHGYKKAHAIGLPFAYLPKVDVTRRAGSLLVMPPHGRREYFRGNSHAESYVRAILEIKDRFSEIVVCVTERDYARGEWRTLFQDAGLPVIIGANHFDTHPLLRLKELLSSFEYMTTNAFGSHIAYAAHCGAKVSLYGPYCEWRREKITHAVKMFPALTDELVSLQSENCLRSHFPFLFTHPAEAEILTKWGNHEIGFDLIKAPSDILSLFDPFG